MKKIFLFLFLFLIYIIIVFPGKKKKMKYPKTKLSSVKEIYFDTTISDPYRWLEDDYSNETNDWVAKQNSFTDSYLRKIPFKESIEKKLKKIWNNPTESLPIFKNKIYYFYLNNGLQNQAVLYLKNKIDDKPKILIDPNSFSKDGSKSLGGIYFSNDNNYLGYSVNSSGSDWQEFRIIDLKTNIQLPDSLKWIKFSGMSWFENGFFYKQYPKVDKNSVLSENNIKPKIYYHKLGTQQVDDVLIYSLKNKPYISPWISISENEKYMFLYNSSGTYGNSLSFKESNLDETDWTTLVDDFISEISIIKNIDDSFIALTNRTNSYNQLIKIHITKPNEKNWEVLINGSKDEVLKEVKIVGKKIFAHFYINVTSVWKVFTLKGEYLYTIDLPGKGIVEGFNGDIDQMTTWYSFNNSVNPTTLYEFDIMKNSSKIYRKSTIDFKSENYILKQEFYPSKDGTLIPIFICHKKNIKMDGRRPTLLYGYGGFNISVQPYFNKTNTILYDNDGVYAIANIRGGSEYGEDWHKGGILKNKQNVFDDFAYAAKYLIKKNITSSDFLAIQGASNGGLLIGAVINQNPNLFRVAFPEVGVMDMLRYEKFTIGYAWSVEYGSVKEKENFDNIIKYSPLHNIKNGRGYPSTFIYTADHDDRVVPAHSFKYAATLQLAQGNNNPILIRIGENVGHGFGKPTNKIIKEQAEKLAFLFYEMGLND